MLNHYFATALRNHRRHWVTTCVNTVGLALGLLCFISSLNLIHFYKLDDHQFAADRTYFITQQYLLTNSTAVPVLYRTAPWLLADELKAALPGIEVARRGGSNRTSVVINGVPIDVRMQYADANLLDLFALPFVSGNKATALTDPRSAVITRQAALRLFGTDAAVGKTMLIRGTEPVTIAGVITIPVQPTHLLSAVDFDSSEAVSMEVLLSMDMLRVLRARDTDTQAADKPQLTWDGPSGAIYVRLPSDGSLGLDTLNATLSRLATAHAKDGIPRRLDTKPIAEYRQIGLDELASSSATGLSWSTTLLFIAAVVLLVSCLNYANLATAIGAQHRREQGLRRVLGATTSQMTVQQSLESVVTLVAAMLLALAVLVSINPWLKTSQNVDLLYVWRNSAPFWQHVGAAFAVTAVISGVLPMLAATRVHARAVLERSRGGTTASRGSHWLVGAQFMLASVLIVFVLVVRWQQHELIRNAQSTLPAPIVAISNPRAVGVDFKVLRAELLRRPHIEAVTATGYAPWGQSYGLVALASSPESGSREIIAINEPVDHNYFSTMEIKFLAGSGFFDVPLEENGQRSVFPIVIGNKLAQSFGWSSPDLAVGQQLYPGEALRNAGRRFVLRVIGVVEDKTLQFTTNGAQATVYTTGANAGRTPLVRVARDHVGEGYAQIQAVWRSLAPNVALRAEFLDDVVRDYAKSVAVYANVLSTVTILAVCIALSGLIGMAVHMVNRRTHEIGIRKTLGAKTSQVVALLLSDVARPIVVGSIIGWPLAYWISQTYLSIYLHRIDLNPLPFVGALLGAVAIGFVAVGWHSARAARLKPADVLRHE